MAICNMGMGGLAINTTIFKRKFRWGMKIKPNCGGKQIDEFMVKVAARPNLSLEETEINMKNGKMYIPGKATWESITVTLYDVVGKDDSVKNGIGALYNWITSVYQFNVPDSLRKSLCMGSAVIDYAAEITLNLYNGCGVPLETWTIKDAWPQAVNFGDLDYSSSEEVTVELTIRYADVMYDPVCFQIQECSCTSC